MTAPLARVFATLPAGHRVWASLSAFAAAWMVMMATRYFSLSAGDIEGGLGIGADDGSWLTTAYAAAEPVGVAAGCWLAMGLSLRRVLLAAIVLFLGASILAAIVPTFPVMLGARVLMGLAAGAIMPLSILTQLRAFTLTWRPLAIGLYASATTMAAQLAGTIDAWAVLNHGWTALLWASVPPGALALVAGSLGLWRDPIRWRLFIHADLGGLVSLSTGLVLLACGLSQGNRLHWSDSPAIIALLLAGVACLVLFGIHERRHLRHPVVFLNLTRRWNLALGALATVPFQLAAAFSGTLVPAFLGRVQGFRPDQIAPALTAALWPQLAAYASGVLLLRYRLADARTLMIVGLSCVALASVADWKLTSDWMVADLSIGQVLQGVGLPLIILPLLVLFVGEVTPAEGVYAASIFNISRSLAGTFATAWVATALRLGGQANYAELLMNTGFYPDSRRTIVGTAMAALSPDSADQARTHLRAIAVIAEAARRQATVLATSHLLVTLSLLLLASCGLVLIMAEFASGHPDRKAKTNR